MDLSLAELRVLHLSLNNRIIFLEGLKESPHPGDREYARTELIATRALKKRVLDEKVNHG